MYTDDLEIELRLARFEALMDRRPILLSSVLLRQNPHNIHEWHKRVKLFEGKPREVGNIPFFNYFNLSLTSFLCTSDFYQSICTVHLTVPLLSISPSFLSNHPLIHLSNHPLCIWFFHLICLTTISSICLTILSSIFYRYLFTYNAFYCWYMYIRSSIHLLRQCKQLI